MRMPTALKYWLLQLPSTVAVGLLLYWGYRSEWITATWVAGILAAWVIKDALMYPLTKDAYRTDNALLGHPVGEVGTVRQPLEPRGTVWINGAIWRAELAGTVPTASGGARVRVIEARGLMLVVERIDDDCAGDIDERD